MRTLSFSKFLLFAFISLLYVGTTAQELAKVPAEQVGLSSERLNVLTKTFQEYVDNGELSGAVALVARKGKVAYLQSFGKNDMENNIPMTESSIFRSFGRLINPLQK